MPEQQQNAVEIRGLTYSWANNHRVIFDNIDIDAPLGKITAIMGPSGSGNYLASFDWRTIGSHRR